MTHPLLHVNVHTMYLQWPFIIHQSSCVYTTSCDFQRYFYYYPEFRTILLNSGEFILNSEQFILNYPEFRTIFLNIILNSGHMLPFFSWIFRRLSWIQDTFRTIILKCPELSLTFLNFQEIILNSGNFQQKIE